MLLTKRAGNSMERYPENLDRYYLVTVCDEDAAGKEEYLSGQNPKASIGKSRTNSVLPSEVDQFYTDKIAGDIEKMKNAEETATKSTYFYYGTNLEELKECVDLLLAQPTSEEAIDRLQSGVAVPGDAYGDKKVTTLIMSIDIDIFNKLVSMGLGDTRGAKYETLDGSVVYLDNECSFGDLGFKKLVSEGEVIAYGGICEILRDTQFWGDSAGYDATNNYAIHNYVVGWSKIPEPESEVSNLSLPPEVADFYRSIKESGDEGDMLVIRDHIIDQYGEAALRDLESEDVSES